MSCFSLDAVAGVCHVSAWMVLLECVVFQPGLDAVAECVVFQPGCWPMCMWGGCSHRWRWSTWWTRSMTAATAPPSSPPSTHLPSRWPTNWRALSRMQRRKSLLWTPQLLQESPVHSSLMAPHSRVSSREHGFMSRNDQAAVVM